MSDSPSPSPGSPPATPAPVPPPEPLCRDALAPAVRNLFASLGERPWSDGVYLAGSAALTLHLGHRRVAALDLMAPANDLTSPRRRDLLLDLLEFAPGTRVETARDGFLSVRIPSRSTDDPERLDEEDRTSAVRFYHYPYPLAGAPVLEPPGPTVASLLDLGLMKLGAIISRGTRRDFVDLHLLCRRLPLGELLEAAPGKFPHVRDFPLQALKGLADLSLVGADPMPSLRGPATDLTWDDVEAWLAGPVRRLARRAVGLDDSLPEGS